MMGTVVSVQVLGHGDTADARDERGAAIARAMRWFSQVEQACSRFDPTSELNRLVQQVGVPVAVSELLFQATAFAHAVAEQSDGAFDPTVGARMVERGYDREYRTGRRVAALELDDADATWRDLVLDVESRTIALRRPLQLDLGAVAKGLAIDLAAAELRPFGSFTIDAGGDLYAGGRNPDGDPWAVGIRHPREPDALVETIHVSDVAVCTSGDYERGEHLLDPRTGDAATALASVTVLAPSAMVADALATAVYVLGEREGLALLERHGAEGLVVHADASCARTAGFPRG